MNTMIPTLIFIEKLDFISVLYLLFFSREDKDIFFIESSFFGKVIWKLYKVIGISGMNKVRQINYSDLPGSYFNIKNETGLIVNDLLYEKHQNNVFINAALKFCGNDLFSIAIKKELYNRYTLNRVKAMVFLKYLSSAYSKNIFIPSDAENIGKLISEKHQIQKDIFIPNFFFHYLKITHPFKILIGIIIYPISLLILIIWVFTKGIKIKEQKPKGYSFGFDIYKTGIMWSRPYSEFFIYDKKHFHPAKNLHVIRGKFSDTKTKALFQKYHYPYVEWNTLNLPIRYFFNRIIIDLLIKGLKNYLFLFIKCNKNPVFIVPSLAVLKMTIDCEIFYRHFNVKVFISRDDYSPLHIVRTLVARKNANYTVGFMHGDYSVQGEEVCTYLLFDKYFIYGDFYRDFNKKGLAHCDIEVIGAGLYGLDKTFRWSSKKLVPLRYKELRGNYKIVVIYASSYVEGAFINKKMTLKFYRDVLNLTESYSNIFRVIKPKNDEFNDKDFQEVLNNHERVIVDNDTWSYKLLLIADLIICINCTTIGLEGLMAGKKVLYYEVSNYRDHIYAKYHPLLVAFNEEELRLNLDQVLRDNMYIDDTTLNYIRAYHGYTYDGNMIKRLKDACIALSRK